MRKHSILFLLLLSITAMSYGQTKDKASEQRAIEATVLGYIENFFENNTEEMLKYLHPNLAKGGVSKKKGQETLYYEKIDLEKLKGMLQSKKALAKADQDNKVIILDTFQNTASVRLETGYPQRMRWIEYIQLSKIDGKWLINNILWDFYPRKNSPQKR